MSDGASRKKKLPFVSPREQQEINEEFLRRIDRKSKKSQELYLSRSNIYSLKHGRHWRAMHSDDPAGRGQMQKQAAEVVLETRKIVEHDIGAVLATITELVEKMNGAFEAGLLRTLDESTRASGNVVTNLGLKAAWEEALSKIAFGVDEFGRPSPPQMLVPPAVMAEVRKWIERPDPEFDARIAAIKESKEKGAIEDEARRLSRYRYIR